MAKAWVAIEARLRDLGAAQQGRKFKLASVTYDAVPGESVIDELPDQPKSSRPDAVEVAVRLRAVYVQE